ncbi:MAG: hypothetical protein A4S09_08290 [Proteobacteria bacterium SG_bin7]|nr:MAG: hypothetical protein A4S09_08290 [Proteobacteria bacterium SG_bin7]
MKRLIYFLVLNCVVSSSHAQQIKPFRKPSQASKPDTSSSAVTASTPDKKKSENSFAKSKDGKLPFSEAQPEDINNENYPDLIESFDYPNADITDVIKAISELTGKNFIIDQSVTRGKISIIAPTQITVAEAYKAFLTALSVNGLTVIPAGKFLKITQARNAIKDSIETYSGKYAPDADIMITRIVHMKYISAEELDKRIRILVTKDGTMAVYPPTNSLIISDFGSNIERLVKIIERLDVPGFEEKMEVVKVRYARAKDLADLVEQILDKDAKKRGGRGGAPFASTVPRFGDRQDQANTENYRVINDDRTNSLIVVGNQQGIARVKKLIERLDYKMRPEDAGGVHVYYVKYGDAEAISNTLSGITQKAKSGGSSNAPVNPLQPFNPVPVSEAIFGGDVKIQADKATNSLIVTASKNDYETVLSLLRKIDRPRDQIFVEAVIMETNATKVNDYRVSFFKYEGNGGYAKTGWGGGNSDKLLSPIPEGGILGFATGADVTIKDPTGKDIPIKSLVGLLSILKTTTDANILSSPQIMALNNEKATIEVGRDVPVSTTTTPTTVAGAIPSTSIERKNATIKLVIEPFISPNSDKIRMKIEQDIKDVSKEPAVGASTLAANAISLDTRSIQTSIVIRNGDTAVLGGLMKNTESVQINKVPILGDIPILGWLFKSQNTDIRKSNLLVFLTPRIVRAGADNDGLVNEKLGRRANFIKTDMGGRDPFGKEIEQALRSKSRRANVDGNKSDIIDETLGGESQNSEE